MNGDRGRSPEACGGRATPLYVSPSHTKRVTDRYEASPTRDSREIVAIPNRDSLSTSFALGSSFRSLARSASVTRPSRRARRPAAVQPPSRVLPVISRPRDTKSIYR